MARKKKTVVAPKVIMQERPPRRILWVALSSVGVMLAMWFSYDYGVSLHAGMEKPGNAAPDRISQQRIAQLEQEHDRLRQRIAKLERELQAGRKPVRNPEAIVRALAGNKPPPPTTVPTEAPKVDTQAAVGDGPSNQLKLTDVEVEPTDSENRFRFSFSVIHPGNEPEQVVGTIWIAVNGLSNGKPTRLSLKQISSETHPYLDMRFTGQQIVDGELTLPPDFEPKNIAIEAKPYDKKYRGASGKFDWTADG
ncbi:MAG: hypothetical protein PVI91_15900 [Gammaproteobacteria bacterium]|jgi:hypothetical protein